MLGVFWGEKRAQYPLLGIWRTHFIYWFTLNQIQQFLHASFYIPVEKRTSLEGAFYTDLCAEDDIRILIFQIL